MKKEKITRLEEKVGGNTISLETGLMARQSDGAVTIQMGETILLAAAVAEKKQKEGVADFVPLAVTYKEKTYAAGKIPGGFFKREGRPTTKEILASRLTDRSLRPLFPEGYNFETNVTSMVLSSDLLNDADVLSITAASAALMISSIPFDGPIAAVRVGMAEDKIIINPTYTEREKSDIDMVIAATPQGILMVEGGCREIAEETVLKAFEAAKPEIEKLCKLQLKLKKAVGKEKFDFEPLEIPSEVSEKAHPAGEKIAALLAKFPDKDTLSEEINKIKEEITASFGEEKAEEMKPYVNLAVEDILYRESRKLVLSKKVRVDGRKTDEIRPLNSMIGLIPRAHGSALFTRGQTQALVTCTLGTPEDMQLIEGLTESYRERFLLHYNFPGFATGECKFDRGPGRREIGHGELAKRALLPLFPGEEDFGYTVRIVSDIMESNGSSSMASVCGGSLSLFDAGVPMKDSCAGIAMGLIAEGGDYAVLSDILGMEDHLGDMDFKVTGTRKGITAFQMDVKIVGGLTLDMLSKAIEQAKKGRMHILRHMESVIASPKEKMSEYAPRLERIQIPQDKIGALIGPGGKNIRELTERTSCKIEVDDEGVVHICGIDSQKVEEAKKEIELISADVEVGKVYKGKVVSIQNFGAFVEVLPGKDGLLHISEISTRRIAKVEDELKLGDMVDVKVVEMDNMGKFRLSHKVLMSGSQKPEKK
jgi:polyribonucleotide nucleotidyltransferase